MPRPLQTVQRAEFGVVILALQASTAVHLGVDNLNEVRHVGRLLDGRRSSCPAELLHDGDLVLLRTLRAEEEGHSSCYQGQRPCRCGKGQSRPGKGVG